MKDTHSLDLFGFYQLAKAPTLSVVKPAPVATVPSNWAEVHPVIDYSMRALCAKAYPGHPKGCPNLNDPNHPQCPPHVPRIEVAFALTRPVWAVWNVFPFGEHVARMREKHPAWSRRQLECCLYWQGTGRKDLKRILGEFLRNHRGLVAYSPEALGVNVTETMRSIGIELEWPPVTVAYQIVFAGSRA